MEPTVIDEELCRRCISVRRTAAQQTGEPQDTQKAKDTASSTPFTEVNCLIFSFKNVLKIDNLIGFERLVKLQLDNNIIEKIENLAHLSSLEWLDLSFNNISEISVSRPSLTSPTPLSPRPPLSHPARPSITPHRVVCALTPTLTLTLTLTLALTLTRGSRA